MNIYLQLYGENIPSFTVVSSPSDPTVDFIEVKEVIRQFIERAYPTVYHSKSPWELRITFWKEGEK